jgi:hypothetical protein
MDFCWPDSAGGFGDPCSFIISTGIFVWRIRGCNERNAVVFRSQLQGNQFVPPRQEEQEAQAALNAQAGQLQWSGFLARNRAETPAVERAMGVFTNGVMMKMCH